MINNNQTTYYHTFEFHKRLDYTIKQHVSLPMQQTPMLGD